MPRRDTAPTAVVLHLAGLLALLLYIAARTPVVAVDHDLWYHLSHGRFIFAHGEIPTTSYFSFLSPQRVWVDYYWLFQVVVYPLFELAGYYGILALRTVLLIGFLAATGSFLLRRAQGTSEWLWFAFLLGLYASHGLERYMTVRPHMVSYLMIPLLLGLIEAQRDAPRPRRLWWIPLLALIWVNTHGIEYPVLILITTAYVGEMLVAARRSGTGLEGGERCLALALVAAMATIFATPHGLRLLRVPFRSTEYAAHYIGELSQLPPSDYFTYHVSPTGWTHLTASNLVLLIALLALVAGLLGGKLRLSHLLLFLGGVFLLSKAVRFTYECSLLALPLLRAQLPPPLSWQTGRRVRPLRAAVTVLALGLPWLFLLPHLPERRGTYPLSLEHIPHGIARFLRAADAPGPVLNNPNVGGYLEWTLPPGYPIAMDLEIPFLFTDEDMFQVASSFFDQAALGRFLDQYRPTWIATTLAAEDFGDVIAAFPDYRLVFFDDETALYLDSRSHPDLAARHAIARVDPFRLDRQRFSVLSAAERRDFYQELERISEVDEDVSRVNQALAILANLEGRPAEARRHIERVLRKSPLLPRAHAILGDALVGSGDTEAGVASYRYALRLSKDDDERSSIRRSLAAALAGLGRYDEAWETFRLAIGTFNVEASYQDLYELGRLAAAAGRPDAARKALHFAAWKTPREDVEGQRRIAELLARLGEDPSPAH